MSRHHRPVIHQCREVAASRLFRIESLELEFANGNRRTFERLRSPDRGAVMIVAQPDPEHVLLIREYAAGIDDYVLTLPKGVIDPGEDMITAANRELQEECGFSAARLEPLIELSLAPNYMNHRISVIMASNLEPSRLPGDEPEPLTVETVALEQLDTLLATGELHEGRAVAALLLVRERLRENQELPALW
ncbi:ADP compounds hydrolase NudE [Kushneria phosphatilytica]|nr:ADP compounds hydrolase NudE [Kushneria phosphatilytica]